MGIFRQALGIQTLSETPVGDYSSDVTPPSRQAVTARSPMGLTAFYRGVVIVQNMAAPMPISAWRWGAPIDSPLVAQPDPWMTRRRFLALTISGLLFRGNAYWRKMTAANGDVVGLRVAEAGRAYRDGNGAVRYSLVIDGKSIDLPAAEVEHLRFLEVPGLLDGLGPLQACRARLEGIAAVAEYADDVFGSADSANGILSIDARIDRTIIQETKKAWYRADDDGVNPNPSGGPSIRVLGQGATYTRLGLNPKDAQWIEAQGWGVLEVARLLGLPGDYLLAAVEGSSLTYTNLEMIDTSFVKRTLLPDYLQPIEEALGNVLPRGQAARFDLAEFLRPDAKTRADIDAIYLDKGVYDADFVRARDGIPASTSAGVPA